MNADRHSSFVKELAAFVTDPVCIARQLNQRCTGAHRHLQLIRGRAKAAEAYPGKLREAAVNGLMGQLHMDGGIQGQLHRVCHGKQRYKCQFARVL